MLPPVPLTLRRISILLPLITLLTVTCRVTSDGADRSFAGSRFEESSSSRTSSTSSTSEERYNLVFVVADQLRFDALRFVQDGLAHYYNTHKIRTPNLDRLATTTPGAVVFDNTYCQAAVCGASRASFMTGNTIRRTGVSNNNFMNDEMVARYPQHSERVQRLKSFTQILVDDMGYNGIHLGKWHLPNKFLYSTKTGKPLFRNHYTFENDSFTFTQFPGDGRLYRPNLDYMLHRDGVSRSKSLPRNYMSQASYAPIRLDPSRTHAGGQGMGRDTLAANYSMTAIEFQAAIVALRRLVDEGEPFLLSVQNGPPHPPYVSSGTFMNSYYNDRENLFVSPSITDPMTTSAYAPTKESSLVRNATDMAELVAVYYGMVEEIDVWMGELMNELVRLGVWNNTLLVFTGDHGEMLGAHGRTGKCTFHEESSRVPMILKLPSDNATGGRRVSNPVGLLDLHATILDYLNAPTGLDTSDGRSLRRYIERTSYNEKYDDTIVVTEYEYGGDPTNAHTYGYSPAFMIRKGDYKLILPRVASSPKYDMLYNLKVDRFEMKNLLAGSTKNDPVVVGKAEGLKVLLVEWLKRHDTEHHYFSSPKYSYDRTRGDFNEVMHRRTWKKVNMWISDTTITMGRPTKTSSQGDYRRNEYLYVGRTVPGTLTIYSVSVRGSGSSSAVVSRFSVHPASGTVSQNGSLRIKVSYYSATDANTPTDMQVYVDLRTSETNHTIPIVWEVGA